LLVTASVVACLGASFVAELAAAEESHPQTTSADAPSGQPSQCNPYFPMPSGGRWVFELRQADGREALRRVVTVKSAKQDGDVATVELEQTVGRPDASSNASAGSATTSVRCEAGAVSLTVAGSAGPGGAGSRAGVKAKTDGLPAADKLVVGYAWRSESDIEATNDGKVFHSRAMRGSKVEAIEPVTVPAGTFPRALRVVSVENVASPGDDRREVKQDIVEWYVRGLGLVKREARIGSVKSSEQLVEYAGLRPDK
jgi:hypothetical protein